MEPALISPASATLAGIPAKILFILIPLAGIGIFAWIMRRRIAPLLKAAPDNRFQRIPERIRAVLKIWLGQWRHPRYMLAGVLHIILFFGFLILGARSTQLVVLGFVDGFTLPGFGGIFGAVYNVLKDYAGTAVFICRRHPRHPARCVHARALRCPREIRQGPHARGAVRPGSHRHLVDHGEPVRGEPHGGPSAARDSTRSSPRR